MQPVILLVYLAGFACILFGLLFLILGLRSSSRDEIAQRLQDFVDQQAPKVQVMDWDSTIRKKELTGTVSSRVLLPAFKRLGKFFGRLTPAKTLDEIGRQLAIAGNPLGLGAREFYGLRLVFTLLGFWLSFQVLRGGMNQMNFLLSSLALVIGTSLPKAWLRGRVRARQNKIRKGLPDALDMLSVCADAGLGFDQSLQRISEQWKSQVGVEFGRVVSEMEMGFSRQQALRNLAERLDISELSSFVAVIIQSDQLGMSIADTLHAQAGQMREERRFRAQEEARKIPLKMLFPMVIFILPSMFAVILGPVYPILRDFFQTLATNAQ